MSSMIFASSASYAANIARAFGKRLPGSYLQGTIFRAPSKSAVLLKNKADSTLATLLVCLLPSAVRAPLPPLLPPLAFEGLLPVGGVGMIPKLSCGLIFDASPWALLSEVAGSGRLPCLRGLVLLPRICTLAAVVLPDVNGLPLRDFAVLSMPVENSNFTL